MALCRWTRNVPAAQRRRLVRSEVKLFIEAVVNSTITATVLGTIDSIWPMVIMNSYQVIGIMNNNVHVIQDHTVLMEHCHKNVITESIA